MASVGLSRAAAAGASVGTTAGAATVAARGLRTMAAAAAGGGTSVAVTSQYQQHQLQRQQRQHAVHASAAALSSLHTMTQQPLLPGPQQAAQQQAVSQRQVSAAAAAAGAAARHLTSSAAAARQFAGSAHPSSAPLQELQQQRSVVTAAATAAHPAAAAEDAVGLGSIVEFERNKAYLVGLTVKQRAQGWEVEVFGGPRYAVKAADIKCVIAGPGLSMEDLELISRAADMLAQEATLLQLAWDVATDGGSQAGDVFTVPEMAEFLFNNRKPESCAAALRLLREDRLYFKQAGRSPPMFSGRTRAQVDSLAAELRHKELEAAAWEQFVSDVQAAQAAPRPSKPNEDAWREGPHGARLAALEALALGDLAGVGPERTLAHQTLVGLGKTPSTQDAAEVLQSVGWWPPHLQLNLVAAGISERFPPELEEEAARLLESPPADPDAARRRDFTQSHTIFTIDDASTTEIDDGLSLERLPDGRTKVWVHIADPSRWVAPGSLLAQEAEARTKSMYLPTGVVPMFPKSLAEGPFSLREGVPTEAMSVGACLSEDGELDLDSISVVPSLVQPARRLTYVLVDEIFQECSEADEPDLFELRKLSAARRSWRLTSGATEIAMPESMVSVEGAHEEEPRITIEEEDQYASPARQLVAEMMILAGEAVGELGRQLGVPLPYRGQAEPVLPDADELAAVPPGPCQAVMLRMRMTRSVMATAVPLRHAGLGLEAYVQFTSPIRRYGDLLAHWQLKAALRGDAPRYDAGQLSDVIEATGATTQALMKLEREAESYWVAEYFRQAARSEPTPAWAVTFLCWLKQEVGLGRVLMDGLGLETVVRINSPVQPGDQLVVKCSHTDVKMGMWRLDAINPDHLHRYDIRNEGCAYHQAEPDFSEFSEVA
ncbi:ribonuclease [Chlorella sorokiniana]|uniref:Ribonuclease n=1 Tax=Chlorella sorokiniana TaxID=3076 RepID=A0A2P6TXX4_CHLSO|nr:ribonuclease [Chlorella sorokiniana]|eukprot:PRW58916.1 ribonuclease [Chlorella sorokiniana]